MRGDSSCRGWVTLATDSLGPSRVFGQTFAPSDLATIAVLVVLEALLSIDNALVLGLMALRVEAAQRMRALSYGLAGALVLRVAMISLAAYLIKWSILKLAGGLYLIWVAGRHLVGRRRSKNLPPREAVPPASFWSTVAAIELMDIAFAADSILAAVALVGRGPPGVIHPKLWVIVLGGMLGAVMMRFAAAMFTRLLEQFPGLRSSAYLLVLVIGLKLLLDWGFNTPTQPHHIDFQDPRAPAMWIFWGAMVVCLTLGLRRSR
jgi:YkoY family integral membrane protein